MTVKEYLYQTGMNELQLGELLGYKTVTPIKKKLDEEMPERWARKLEEMSSLGLASNPAESEASNDTDSEREPKITDEQISDWINTEGRESDKDPNVNNMQNSGFEVIGPQQIKLKTIEGYIEAIYSGAAMICKTRGDEIAAEVILKYTPEYKEAWIDYIKYDSRILKYLEALQIGTPIGNLIGVHVISMGAYVFARVTAKELANIATANGTGETEL